ncbi:MAG: macro domain-containing protein [Clostridia bacterium]|nr:macro domain-containing protein [Clostridia bacterium]
MPFNIIRNDITRLETDAIVNAANVHLKEGGGVCGAIFAAAGKEKLQKACDKIGGCNVGEAVITKGFGLKASYIIHTVGPVYGKDPLNEEKQLYSCYLNSLELAKNNNLNSIAFPLISSGIYGYPKAEAIKIATRAIKDFLAENEMTVFLVVYDKASFSISEKLFSDVASYIDDRMVKVERRRTEVYNSFSMAEASDEDYACIPNFIAAPKPMMSANSKKSLKDFLNTKTETFSEMLFRLIDQKGYTDVEVYKRANIDRKLFSKMRKKDYVPKKATVFALIIALRLNMADAKILLSRAGFAFNESSKFDLIIEYFIENENYDIFEINETLFAFEQQLLGA